MDSDYCFINRHSPHPTTALMHSNPRVITHHHPLTMFSGTHSCRLYSSSCSSFSPNNFPPKTPIHSSQQRNLLLPPLLSSPPRNPSLTNTSSLDRRKGEKSHHQQELLHQISFKMILEVIMLIWRLPGFISGFLKREETMLDKVEGEIDEAADAITLGAKVVEGLAEGVEKAADAIGKKDIEKVAKTVEEDAKKVEVIMEEVKERTKTIHDELEEATGSLETSMQGVKKVIVKVEAKSQKATKHGTVDSTQVTTPQENSMVDASLQEHHSPLQDFTTNLSPSS